MKRNPQISLQLSSYFLVPRFGVFAEVVAMGQYQEPKEFRRAPLPGVCGSVGPSVPASCLPSPAFPCLLLPEPLVPDAALPIWLDPARSMRRRWWDLLELSSPQRLLPHTPHARSFRSERPWWSWMARHLIGLLAAVRAALESQLGSGAGAKRPKPMPGNLGPGGSASPPPPS